MALDDHDALGVFALLEAEDIDHLNPVRRARAGEGATDPRHLDALAARRADPVELLRAPFARRADAAHRIVGGGEGVARAEADELLDIGLEPFGARRFDGLLLGGGGGCDQQRGEDDGAHRASA